MYKYSEIIVGLWFVPVVVFILVPLAMLCVWSVIKFFKKIGSKIEHIEESAKEARDESLAESLKSQTTA